MKSISLILCALFILIASSQASCQFLLASNENSPTHEFVKNTNNPSDNTKYTFDFLEELVHLETKSVSRKQITLQWQIPNEIAHRNYVIQRSEDLENYFDVCLLHSKVASKKIATTFTDKVANSGVYYYRLAELDEEGVQKNYAFIEVNTEEPFVENASVPVAIVRKFGINDHVYVRVNDIDKLEVKVSTTSGMAIVCEVKTMDDKDFILMPVSPIAEGNYIVKVKNSIGEKEFKIAGGSVQPEGIGF